MRAAVRILERPSQKPFCIYLPLTFPHPPYAAPDDFHDMYNPGDVPPLRPPGLPHRPLFHQAIRETRRLDRLTGADFRKINAVYLGMISYSDWLLGELLAAIDRTGHANDTALFIFSDHGDWGGDFGLVEKWPNAMEDTLTHIPLLARVPGYARGHVSKEIVELFDVMPTCLQLCGIEPHHTHFASSLIPQLQGKPGNTKRAAFCEGGYNTYEPQCFEPFQDFNTPANIYYPKVKLQNERPQTSTRSTMIRTLDWKLILRPDGENELYDLTRDPRELNNLIGQSSFESRRRELESQILKWYVRTSDVAPWKHDPRALPS